MTSQEIINSVFYHYLNVLDVRDDFICHFDFHQAAVQWLKVQFIETLT